MKKIVKFAFAAGLATMAFFFTNTEEATSLTQYEGSWVCVDNPNQTFQSGDHVVTYGDENLKRIGCSWSAFTTCWKITERSLDVYDSHSHFEADIWGTFGRK